MKNWGNVQRNPPGSAEPQVPCPDCDGCGKVANTEGREPWTYWEKLPEGSALAVIVGVVRPVPCTRCGGTGALPAEPGDKREEG